MVGIETGRVEAEVRAALFGSSAEPTRIDRYEVRGRLGRGAMGIVYEAHDPRLDRRVAVKLVDTSRVAGDEYQERLRREAKAMAKLSHPNIVQVYDAGLHELDEGSAVYVAMELVEGEDLGRWLQQPRTWRETLAVLIEAGRGLSAAHQAGLVHRDFKPDNVLVAADGRVRVGDFGLARSGVSEPDVSSAALPDADPKLTSRDAVLGTPAYMAPEVFDAQPADARSDQFSFCVALWQGVYGAFPFEGKSVRELAASAAAGEVVAPPDASDVPPWLRQTLLRGLRSEPSARHRSMAALLGELTRDRRGRRRRMVVAGVAIAVVAVGGWSLRPRESDPCGASTDLSDVWGPNERAELRRRFAEQPQAWVEATALTVERELDAYAAHWLSMREANCRATKVEHEQTETLMDLRTRCLAGRRAALEALVPVLLEGDETTVRRASTAVRALPRLARCADADALRAAVPPPDDPGLASAVEAVRAKLPRLQALSSAGRQPEALELAEPLLAEAEATAYVPLIAETHWHLAELHSDLAAFDRAEEHASKAYWAALEAGSDDVEVHAALLMVHVVGVELRRDEDAERWAKHAEAAVQKVGLGGLQEAALQARVGAFRVRQGENAEAIERLERAAALAEELQGPDSLDLANVRGSLSMALRNVGRADEAGKQAGLALEITQTQLGPDHPDLAPKLVHFALGLRAAGKTGEARAAYERALGIVEAAYGPKHRNAGVLLLNLGNILREEGKDAEARERYVRARDILTEALGPDHIHVANLRSSIALTLQNEGKLDEAIALYEETLVAWRNAEGNERRTAGIAANNVGNILLDKNEPEEALRYHLESREILVAVLGPDDIMVASPSEGLGDGYLAAGQPDKAADALEDALRIRGLAGEQLSSRLHLVLARALWDSGRDRERAVKLVESHREAADDLGGDARAWLTRNEGSVVLP